MQRAAPRFPIPLAELRSAEQLSPIPPSSSPPLPLIESASTPFLQLISSSQTTEQDRRNQLAELYLRQKALYDEFIGLISLPVLDDAASRAILARLDEIYDEFARITPVFQLGLNAFYSALWQRAYMLEELRARHQARKQTKLAYYHANKANLNRRKREKR